MKIQTTKFIEYFIYIFISTFPFLYYYFFLYAGTSSRAINLAVFVSIVGIIFSIYLFKKDSKIYIPKSPILLSILVYFLFLIISALVGLNPDVSFWSMATRTMGIWYLINLGFFIYFLWVFIDTVEKRNRLILTIVFSTSLYSILSFLSPEGVGWFFKKYSADAFTFGNSSFAAMYILGAFLLSLYYLFQLENRKWWMYVLPVSLVINPNILNFRIWSGNFSQGIVGEARASAYLILFSLILIFFFWLISKIKDKKIKARVSYSIFGASILIMIVSAFSLLTTDGYLNKLYLSHATAARPLMWEMSHKAISQKPLLGWGTDNFERVFEINYDNRLLEERYGNEAWFDRAHNVFIDQLIENGFIGLILYIIIFLTIVWSMIFVALNSSEKKDRLLTSILIVYFVLHFIELQTAFDTTISYVMVAIMITFAVILFGRTREQMIGKNNTWDLSGWTKYILASVSILYFVWSIIWGVIPFARAQIANGYIRTIGLSEKRLEKYPILLDSPIDTHSLLWRTSTDFQIGIGSNPKVLSDPSKREKLKKELIFFEDAYRDYIEKNPKHFRARLNLADMMIYQSLFGINKLEDAQKVLDEAIDLVPQAPQPYWMKAVAYIYMKKFDKAREYAQKGLELNPGAKQSQDVVRYVEESIKNFPEVDLYFFKQI